MSVIFLLVAFVTFTAIIGIIGVIIAIISAYSDWEQARWDNGRVARYKLAVRRHEGQMILQRLTRTNPIYNGVLYR